MARKNSVWQSHDSANGPFLTIKEGREKGGTGLCHDVFWLCEAEPKKIMARQKMIFSSEALNLLV